MVDRLGDHPQAFVNDITIFGKRRGEGESIGEIKRHIGWFSPELQVHFEGAASCYEVVASGFRDTIGLYEAPTRRQRAAAREILARFGLLELEECPLFSLSSGTQRLVLLLRALVKKPRLLILDEPCQGLDAAHREVMIQTVETIIREGLATVIYVTHRSDEIPPSIKRRLRLDPRG